MRAFLAMALGALLSLGLVAPSTAAPVNTGHIEAELVSQSATATPGSTIYVAVRQKIDKGWHTYWRNAGDSGDATKAVWTLPAGWSAGEFVWPTPSKQPTGPLMNYGYHGEVLLPAPVQVPASAKPGQTVTLKAAVAFLVCSDVCVPEDAVLTLDLPIADGVPKPDRKWGAAVTRTLAEAPKPAGLVAAYALDGQTLKLAVTGASLAGADMADAYFFPFSGTVIDHAKPQAIERGPQGLTLSLTGGYDVQQGKPPAELSGVLSVGGKAWEVSAKRGALSAGASGLGAPAAAKGEGKAGMGLPLAFLFALLGGLVLNLMPCVFPVLSMKAAALASHAHDSRNARAQGLAYLVGVVGTFVLLAGLLIAAKAAGAAVGWGFQLQSPVVVTALAVLMLLVALNLSGVFEVGTSLQGVGGGLAQKQGLAGSFFTGVLAVAVAAPCTAPFMGPALGYALTQNAAVALLVFAGLGVGLAAPFVALSFAPGLLRLMPRPGGWMETLRNVLAFPMYAAVAWLVWVLAQQIGPISLARALGAGVLAAFAAWLFGLAQRRMGAPVVRGLAAVVAVGAVALIGTLALEQPSANAAGGGASSEKAELPSEPWSPERVAALRAEGKPVFVNFTAAWCVTCQVNDGAALSQKSVAESMKQTGAVYLVGDWTKRDAAIAAALSEHGRAGVPLYLVYPAGGGEPVILPQLLTPGLVTDALKKAAKPAA